MDLGQPAPSAAFLHASAITYPDLSGSQQIRVFGTTPTGTLVADSWSGSGWQWFDLGVPSLLGEVDSPSAVSYQDASGDHIRVFAVAVNNHLVADAWDGSTIWTWFDLGLPDRASWIVAPNAVAYIDFEGNAQIRVFAIGRQRTPGRRQLVWLWLVLV